MVIDGVRRRLQIRKYCLTCSPWGKRNNKKLECIRIDGLKTCFTCNQDKAENLYSGTNGSCNICVAEKKRIERRECKAKCIAYLGGKCIKCDYDKCPAAFDFHHKDPSQKDFAIGRQTWNEFEKLKPELDKCDLLCRNCHAEFHWVTGTMEDSTITS